MDSHFIGMAIKANEENEGGEFLGESSLSSLASVQIASLFGRNAAFHVLYHQHVNAGAYRSCLQTCTLEARSAPEIGHSGDPNCPLKAACGQAHVGQDSVLPLGIGHSELNSFLLCGPTGCNSLAQPNGLGIRANKSGGLKGRDSRVCSWPSTIIAPPLGRINVSVAGYPGRWPGLRDYAPLALSLEPNALQCPYILPFATAKLLCQAGGPTHNIGIRPVNALV